MRMQSLPQRQSGIALAVALILLVVLTLLALSGVRLSTMELRMALNDQFRIESFERAQSMVDTSIRDFNNTPVLAQGTVLCACTGGTGACAAAPSGCTVRTSLGTTLSSKFSTLYSANAINVIIRSIPPLNAEPPIGTGYSLDKFDAAYLRVEGIYDQNSSGYGASHVNEGVAIVYGSAGEITTKNGTDALTQFNGS